MPVHHTHWIQPEWPAPANVRAIMTTREGGVSRAPWDSMNLGSHVGDAPEMVQINRARLASHVQRQPVFLEQVHGSEVVVLRSGMSAAPQADACWTTSRVLACTIMVADCLPVLLCDASGRWVAAAHAGWRGLAGVNGHGVLEALLSSLPLADKKGGDVMAWLGPCIGPQAFEVGQDVRSAFEDGSAQVDALFKPGPVEGKFNADLAGLARMRLKSLGITQIYGNDSRQEWCTASQPLVYFSHRRDSRIHGQSGRMAACIWLAD